MCTFKFCSSVINQVRYLFYVVIFPSLKKTDLYVLLQLKGHDKYILRQFLSQFSPILNKRRRWSTCLFFCLSLTFLNYDHFWVFKERKGRKERREDWKEVRKGERKESDRRNERKEDRNGKKERMEDRKERRGGKGGRKGGEGGMGL